MRSLSFPLSCLSLLLPLATACLRAGSSPPGDAPTAQGLPGDALRSELVRTGDLEARVLRDDADLVIFYGGELKGSMDSCGCPKEPRGGFGRVRTYMDLARARNPGTRHLLVAGGWWLDDAPALGGGLREDARVGNRHMLLGLRALGFDALNIGFPDLPGVGELGSALQGLPVTSANLRVRSPVEAFAPTTHLLVERDGLEVGFVGISRTSGDLPAPPSFDVAAPYESARNALRELSGRADLVVLLAFGAPSEARRLAEENAEIDVVIDTFQHRETGAAFRVGQAVWVRAPYEMQRLGELRLWLRDGRVVAALDRQIDMDPEIPDHPELSALQREARQAVRAKQIEIFGP